MPPKLSGPASRLAQHLTALSTQLDRNPTTQELADDLDISDADATALMLHPRRRRVAERSGGGAGGDDGRETGDVLPQAIVPPVDEEMVHEAVVDQLRKADGRTRSRRNAR